MNDIEKVQAAVEKLEKSVGVYEISNGWLIEIEIDAEVMTGDPRIPLTDDPLVVMLYRTIDAQLKILRTTLDDEHADWLTELEWRNSVALAEAILE